MIHSLLNLRDPTETVDREMQTVIHHFDDFLELQKLIKLCRSQWMNFEERHDDLAQMPLVPHVVDKEIFAMIVVPAVAIDVSASKEVLHHFKDVDASFTLHNSKAGLTLPTDLHHSVAIDRGAEAALTVDEADDPLLET